MAATQRMRQGVRALIAFAQPVDHELAAAYLTPALFARFRLMRRSEKLHSLNVLRAILAEGPAPHDLEVAALLHDVGKTRYPLVLWQRMAPVIVGVIAPGLVQRWSCRDPRRWWWRPYVVYVHHPAWSAELIAAAGANPDAIWLVEHHQDDARRWRDHRLYPLLVRLQHADDLN
ncbi:MAG: HD domain-containing protein [Chloroflexi bacterium]|nr:HD domain-containing protein [Chloroflexota bacterium]